MPGNIGELNVRLGAEAKELEAGIRRAERALQRAGQSLTALGNQLTMSLTLPIAGIGVAAIKSAGEVEQMQKALETTMQSAGRGIGEASKELDALRKAAEAPGLDFQQAVKGSVRLQNVGFSAEKAREILVQLANAVSMSGGSAQELDGVTRQFGQMIAKGRVLQEDLSIIQENMPAISQAMEKAFGTKSAEKLRDMGVSAEQFVDGITKQLALLPRVQGGITNAIVNAGVAMKLALAKVGEALNKTFNVTGKLEAFAGWVTNLADRFAAADEGTQRLVIGMAVFAAALGPAIRATNLLLQASGAVVLGFQRMQVAMKTIQGVGIAEWFVKLDRVTKATLWGAIAAGVLALALAFKSLEKDMSAAAQTARQVQAVNEKAAQSVAEERKRVDDLIGTIRAYNTTTADRERALKKLQDIAPQYFGNLKIEKGLVTGLSEAQAKYNKAVLLTATARVAAEEYVATQKKLLDVTGRIGDAQATWQQSIKNAAISMAGWGPLFGNWARNSLDASDATENFGRQTADLILQRERYGDIERKALEELQKMGVITEETTKTTTDLGDATAYATEKDKEAKSEIDLYLDRLAEKEEALRKHRQVLASMGAAPLETVAQATPPPLTSAGPSVGAIMAGFNAMDELTANTGQNIVQALTPTQQLLQALTEQTFTFQEAWAEAMGLVNNSTSIANQAIMAGADAMAQYAERGGASLKELGQAALAGAAKIVRAYIQQGVAAAAFKALASVPFPFNIAAATAAGALAGTLFNKLISSIGIPALAGGGLAHGPTLAVVGDNRGAGVDPEVIAPLSKLQSMLHGSGDDERRLVAEVRGDNLYFLLERVGRNVKRTRGY